MSPTADHQIPAPNESELAEYCSRLARQAKESSDELIGLTGAQVDDWLFTSADKLVEATDKVLEANRVDQGHAIELGLTPAQIDRLKLDPDRVASISQGLRSVAGLASPVGEIFESKLRPNGLLINKVRVPLGVIFFVYESRPNVTADAAAIALKSRNAIILRGGKEAFQSSQAIVQILKESGRNFGIPEHAVQLVETLDRKAVDHFIRMDEWIDLTIPRGGESLIRKVSADATMPVIKHFSGNCHVFVDRYADLKMAEAIVVNSKCHRLGVCNAAESLLVDNEIAAGFLPVILGRLKEQGIEIRGDEKVCSIDPAAKLATEEDFGQEYLDAIISVACVANVKEAIKHINRYGSGHTDAIVSQNVESINLFTELVDSAAVMVNSSTRFNDGGEFGLGAEIGISTDKFHARGPCGLSELTTYKYICHGKGQIR